MVQAERNVACTVEEEILHCVQNDRKISCLPLRREGDHRNDGGGREFYSIRRRHIKKGHLMKKLAFLIIILALALFMNSISPDETVGTVIINLDKIPDFAQRLEIRKCLEGEKGIFTQPLDITLYTDENHIPQYRALKAKLENWGADVILRKETAQNIFDFRALGELAMYIYEGENICESFLSENAVFHSTGFADEEYDDAVESGDTEKAYAILTDNISIVEA